MSKQVDLDKPLSDEDRAYLISRSDTYSIQENDRRFENGVFAPPDKDYVEPVFAPVPTVAPNPIEPGSAADNPPQFVGQRPYGVDRGVWGGSTGVSEQDALAGEAGEPHSTPENESGSKAETEPVDIDDLNVEELKAELATRGLKVSGDKAELQKRLKDALEKE